MLTLLVSNPLVAVKAKGELETERSLRGCLLVAHLSVEAHDGLLLLRGEHAVLQPRPQVVDPPQPAALAVALQPCTRESSRRIQLTGQGAFDRGLFKIHAKSSNRTSVLCSETWAKLR